MGNRKKTIEIQRMFTEAGLGRAVPKGMKRRKVWKEHTENFVLFYRLWKAGVMSPGFPFNLKIKQIVRSKRARDGSRGPRACDLMLLTDDAPNSFMPAYKQRITWAHVDGATKDIAESLLKRTFRHSGVLLSYSNFKPTLEWYFSAKSRKELEDSWLNMIRLKMANKAPFAGGSLGPRAMAVYNILTSGGHVHDEHGFLLPEIFELFNGES